MTDPCPAACPAAFPVPAPRKRLPRKRRVPSLEAMGTAAFDAKETWRYGKLWKNAHVSAAQFGGSACPMLALNEHSINCVPQPLYVTHAITLVLEGTVVVGVLQVALHALKVCRSFDVVAKSGAGYAPSPPTACT